MTGDSAALHALSDDQDRLISADAAISALHVRCGGELPGTIAVPALLEMVRKARRFGLKLARTIHAQDGGHAITAWVEVEPLSGEQAGCAILLRDWRAAPLPPEDAVAAAGRRVAIERQLADLTAHLDGQQRVLAVEAEAPDLVELAAAMRADPERAWSRFVTIAAGASDRLADIPAADQPLHWRLLDGAEVHVAGSPRRWRASLFPQPSLGSDPAGFELCLTVIAPFSTMGAGRRSEPEFARQRLVGRDIAPVLRQPIARIVANAETIRARLAGPLSDSYAECAADIAAAGQHLLSLVEDLADLEAVDAEDFGTAPDRIDLTDVARQAAGILGVRARERGIALLVPDAGESLLVVAEFRRVLQVLLNLIGNAIRYAPENSRIDIALESVGGMARAIVADEGPGLSAEDQTRVFEKFERLGRSGDGGSGLGLYISRRLARTMGGDLTVESAAGQGARFILAVPADPVATDSAPATAEMDHRQADERQ